MSEELEVDPIGKLLEPSNLKVLDKIVNELPALDKVLEWINQMQRDGTLDSALNFMSQALSLLDAVQKSDLVNALISFGMDQLPKIQAVWPLLEKLGSEKTLNLMQQMDWDSLFSAMESLMPIFQKMTGERAVKLLNSMDWDSLLGGLEAITPLMKQMMSDRTTKIMSSIDVDSLLTLAEKLSGLQKTQGWNSMVKTLTDERTINNLSIVMSRMMLALQIWLENLPKTRELGLLGITGQLRSNKDVQLGMGILMGLAEAVGRAFRQSTQ